MSFIRDKPIEVVINAMAIRIAKQARELVRSQFCDEEWIDIDAEVFYLLVLFNLEELVEGLAEKRAYSLVAGSN